jgi:hypothetical protein
MQQGRPAQVEKGPNVQEVKCGGKREAGIQSSEARRYPSGREVVEGCSERENLGTMRQMIAASGPGIFCQKSASERGRERFVSRPGMKLICRGSVC